MAGYAQDAHQKNLGGYKTYCPIILASDTFVRADGQISVGQPAWVTDSNMPVISSNRLSLGNIGGSVDISAKWSTFPTGLTKMFARMTLSGISGGLNCVSGVTIFRTSGTQATRTYYMLGVDNNGSGNGTIYLIRKNSGSQSILAQSPNTTVNVNDILEIRGDASQAGHVFLTALRNGAAIPSFPANPIDDNSVNRLTSGIVGVDTNGGDAIRVELFNNFVAGQIC